MKTQFPHTDEIKAILKNNSDLVKQNGLNYLIPKWKRFTDNYADNEDLIYEWLNEMDARKIIDEILVILPNTESAKITEVLKVIDAKFIEKTFEINECVWNDKVEKENQYDRQKNWYYYRVNQNLFENEDGQFTKRQ
ncbi:hypothetical protein [Flavobacterium sp. AED]|uniref:hypothetical protein n=1 Tax=Flavobacterium sp. AED TaxID=1423323 RepID=UPI00057FA6F0|nr:hypothetical protein [Flavobacterium sp. AED]KIA86156.1 hypothetical protein OA85_00230 [Flavobacterium sp. AED]